MRRYDPDADGDIDGPATDEGAFLICTFWLVDPPAFSHLGLVHSAQQLDLG